MDNKTFRKACLTILLGARHRLREAVVEASEIGGHRVEESKVVRREEDAVERSLEEPRSPAVRRAQCVDRRIIQDHRRVLDRRHRQVVRKEQEVVGDDAFAEAFEQVRDAAAAGEEIERGVERQP